MGKYEVHQVDKNADALYAVARQLGLSVEVIGSKLDALFGYDDTVTVVVEIKTKSGELTDRQKAFWLTFRGAKAVLRTTEDVIALHGYMRRCARAIREVG